MDDGRRVDQLGWWILGLAGHLVRSVGCVDKLLLLCYCSDGMAVEELERRSCAVRMEALQNLDQ